MKRVLGMTRVGWLNYCVLQWFGFRLVRDSESTRIVGLRFAWPGTGWYHAWPEDLVRVVMSPPFLALVAALAWLTT